MLFDYSAGTLDTKETNQQSLLRNPKEDKVEGEDDDASYTKVVDRRWYEKNKHIYPASLWREYKDNSDKLSTKDGKRDALGNSFFFS